MAKLPQGVRRKETKTGGTIYEKRFTVNGERFSVYGASVKEVQEKEQERREEIKKGTYARGLNTNKTITLDEYFADYIEARRKQEKKKVESIENRKRKAKSNTLHTYANIYNKHISPMIGNRKLSTVQTKDILKVMAAAENGCSVNMANYALLIMGLVFEAAKDARIIPVNPCKDIKKIPEEEREAATKTIHKAMTRDEQTAFTEAAKDNYYYTLLAFMLCTGCRVGEAGALKWKDIDTKRNVIHICRTLTKTEDGKTTTGTPKTKTSVRDIPITLQAAEILRTQKTRTGDIYRIDGDSFVFYSPTGQYVNATQVNKEIGIILEKAGLDRKLTSHALRDTFATRFIEDGGTPQALKYQMGHKSYSMTMDLYAQITPEQISKEMDGMRFII